MGKSVSNSDGSGTRDSGALGAAALIPIGQVVADLQRSFPDVTHSSLRFLEREGLVLPTRTPGGHRLYSQQDVERIRQIKAWQAQRLSLDEIRRRLTGLKQIGSPRAVADRFLTAALEGDLPGAAAVIRDADELSMPLSQLFDDVLRPALYEVGARWESGRLPVGQEKEISELARDLIAELSRRHADPAPHGPTIVAACVAGERHELGLRMVVGLLRARGWRVHFLGPDVDPRFLVEVISLRRPDLVLLSATTEQRLPDIERTVETVRESIGDAEIPVVVGGGQAVSDSADVLRSWGVIPVTDEGFQAVLEMFDEISGP
jgi:DNA-binding transcriptional MerR regulator